VSAVAPPPSTALGSIDALKRVKATEVEWELKLRAAHGTAEEVLEHLRAESEAAVKAAQVSAEAERASAVIAARTDADREAAEILAEGTRAAEVAARGEGKRPTEKKDAILAAVLAGFLKD
jgi:vacuolar-type H+-ATPase subunit H